MDEKPTGKPPQVPAEGSNDNPPPMPGSPRESGQDAERPEAQPKED